MASGSTRAVLAALVMNLAVAVAKFLAAMVTGSAAMLAESYHSVSDTLNEIFLFVGLRASRRKPDRNHPFGYGQEQFFWSFVVSMLLFGVAGVLSLQAGITKLLHPEPLDNIFWSYVVLFAAMGFESVALRVAYKELRRAMKKEGITSLWEGIKASKDPVVLTVFFEDSLAITSLCVALVGITLSAITLNTVFDSAASIVIGILLMTFSTLLARETKKLLIGESVTPGTRRKLLHAISNVKEVNRVVSLKTMHLGPESVLVGVELNLEDGLVTDDIERVVDRVEARIKKLIPDVQCYIECER